MHPSDPFPHVHAKKYLWFSKSITTALLIAGSVWFTAKADDAKDASKAELKENTEIVDESAATQTPKNRKVDVHFEVRADFAYTDTLHQGSHSGIYGRYLNVQVNGAINDKITYSLRQRLNKFGEMRSDAFGATDWAWISYAPTKNWSVAGGKQVVLIGGYEYDRAPIDVFFASRFWNNIACYQFGASGTWTSNSGNHALTFQACNSPYQEIGNSCYAYNLFWQGKMGCFSTLYSANMIEYARGHYARFIALGNHLDLEPVHIELDYMTRSAEHTPLFGHDYSIIGKITYQATPWLRIMAKGGYEEFKPILNAPEHVDNPFYGGGLEFFPLKGSRDLHFHATVARLSDNLGNRYNEVSVGVKWHIRIYHHQW